MWRPHFNGRLLALPPNIRLTWKGVAMANTLAFYDTATITVVKGFLVQALGEKKFVSNATLQ